MHLHANLDESGKFKDRDIICISGIITTPENWKVINGPWAIALQKHTIPYLHVKELLQWDGPYASKKESWGDGGRDSILVEFAKVANTAMSHRLGLGLSVSLDAASYRSLTGEQQKHIGPPNLVVFQMFIAAMLGLGLRLFDPGFTIGLICDDDAETARISGQDSRRLQDPGQ